MKLPYYRGPDILTKNWEGEWSPKFNRYHRDNLILLFNIIGYGGKSIWPFSVMSNGDWIGEITQTLAKPVGNYGSYTVDETDTPNTNRLNIKIQIIQDFATAIAESEGHKYGFNDLYEWYEEYIPRAVKILKYFDKYNDPFDSQEVREELQQRKEQYFAFKSRGNS